MSNVNSTRGISRRKFIKTAGLFTGALAIYPLRANAALFACNPAITVGVLAPKSSMIPRMGEDFIAGMNLQFADAGWPNVKIISEEIGVATRSALSGAEKLIVKKKVDILAGFLNPLLQPRLLEILQSSGIPFINVEGGANIQSMKGEDLLINHNSCGYWQANLAMGRWAVNKLGRRVFIASSLYESGYDSSSAFRTGFVAGGGEVLRTRVTHTAAKDELDALMASIRESNPDFVYAMYSGKQAVAFVKAFADAGLAGQVPLAASSFMVDGSILPAMGKKALGIMSCQTWASGLDTTENSAFQKGFTRENGRNADIFAVLGYETAQTITSTISGSLSSLAQTIRGARFDGPRGRFDMKNGHADVPLYMCEIRQEGGCMSNTVLEKLPTLSSWDKLEDRTVDGFKSGWTNAYLCV